MSSEEHRSLESWAAEFPESRLAVALRKAEAQDETIVLDDSVLGGSEGGLECRRCKTKHPLIWQRQLRSADEPMTVFFLCRNSTCGLRWREG